MSSHENRRLERLQAIKLSMSAKDYDKEKVVAECCMDWGASRRTVLEYIRIVELTS